MSRKGNFRARQGFQRIPGAARRYRDTRTGEELSRRQYIKRTEQIASLEAKRDSLRRLRDERGEMPPMARYNAIVAQYKLTHGPGAHVRGKDSQEFRDAYRIYTTTRDRSRDSNLSRVRAAAILGTISPSQARELYPELQDDPALDFDMNDFDDWGEG